MTADNPQDKNRRQLGLIEAVSDHIESLLRPHGFIQAEATPYCVNFKSPKVVLSVLHEPLSYELYVNLTLLQDLHDICTLVHLLASTPDADPKYRGHYQSADPEGVARSVKVIAEILLKYGQDVLAGDPIAFKRMEDASRASAVAYANQITRHSVRNDAEEAWRRRDYAQVLTLYASIEADLTPVRKERS